MLYTRRLRKGGPLGLLLVLVGLLAACGGSAGTDTSRSEAVYVAVAANFGIVHERLARAFEAETGHAVVSIVGSTGKLYAQIVNGGPIDVFLAADGERPARLDADGLVAPDGRVVYAYGRLALWGRSDEDAEARLARLRDGRLQHLAIANPETAPYGAAARRTLENLGLWSGLVDRLVYGESVTQTRQFVDSGAAELGFLAWSQVVADGEDQSWLVPEELHEPLRQEAVLLGRAGEHEAARAYFEFLSGDVARAVIEQGGYRVGDDR